MKTVHLIGVHHNNPEETELIEQVIENVQPDVIFIEEGEERFSIMKDDMNVFKLAEITKTRIINYNMRGRMVRRIMAMQQIIDSIMHGTLFKSVDMRPAFEIGQKMNIDVIPIDKNISQTMNKLGKEAFNISNMQQFTKRFRKRMNSKQSDISSKNINKDNLKSLRIVNERAKKTLPNIHRVLITDRDQIMIQNINKNMQTQNIAVAVVGAAHVPGISNGLKKLGYNVEVHL